MKIYTVRTNFLMNRGTQRHVFTSMEDAIASARSIAMREELAIPEDFDQKMHDGETVHFVPTNEKGQRLIVSIEVGELYSSAWDAQGVERIQKRPKSEPICYVLMRQDVPDYLSGKAMAQSHHAGTKMAIDIMRSGSKKMKRLFDEWEAGRGFGTTIVLSASQRDITRIIRTVSDRKSVFGRIVDPTFPIRDGSSVVTAAVETCAYVFGRRDDIGCNMTGLDLLRGKDE